MKRPTLTQILGSITVLAVAALPVAAVSLTAVSISSSEPQGQAPGQLPENPFGDVCVVPDGPIFCPPDFTLNLACVEAVKKEYIRKCNEALQNALERSRQVSEQYEQCVAGVTTEYLDCRDAATTLEEFAACDRQARQGEKDCLEDGFAKMNRIDAQLAAQIDLLALWYFASASLCCEPIED